MPGREFTSATGYRYGFNGKENDDEIKGIKGSQQDYGMRIYDPRLGKFLSVDPLQSEYPELTPYQFASNRPIDGIDLDGLEYVDPKLITKENLAAGTKTILTFTDVNDATVIATMMTRGSNAINVDGTKADGYDKAFAIGGAFVPFASGSLIKKYFKFSFDNAAGSYKRYDHLAKIANTISGAKNGALRKSLAKAGVDLVGKEAHHIIPTQLLTENKVVQDAVSAGFDFNGVVNGISLTKVAEGGVHANHPNYTDQVRNVLNTFAKEFKDYTPEDAKYFLEGFAEKLKTQIQKESVEAGKKVNKLEIPIK